MPFFSKTIVFLKKDRFYKVRRFVKDNPSLTIVNDDPLLTIVNIIVNTFFFQNRSFFKSDRFLKKQSYKKRVANRFHESDRFKNYRYSFSKS